MILVIDNYDSFVHNLARYVRRISKEQTLVLRNDDDRLDQLISNTNLDPPSAIIVSPGPCGPRQAGRTLDIIQHFHQSTPILGVCLGHQSIIEFFGGEIVVADAPMHGRSSEVTHDASSLLFADVPNRFTAGRYHSLIGQPDSLPDELRVTALSGETIMAVEHTQLPIFGVQFHPESILTEYGYQILFNFFDAAGLNPVMPAKPVENAS